MCYVVNNLDNILYICGLIAKIMPTDRNIIHKDYLVNNANSI